MRVRVYTTEMPGCQHPIPTKEQGRTSRRCLTFLTNMLPSAAKPFTAKTARSVLSRRVGSGSRSGRRWGEIWDIQPEYFWGVSGLNAIALALSRVACDDRKVVTGDGEDGAPVLGVGVEGSCLGHESEFWGW